MMMPELHDFEYYHIKILLGQRLLVGIKVCTDIFWDKERGYLKVLYNY